MFNRASHLNTAVKAKRNVTGSICTLKKLARASTSYPKSNNFIFHRKVNVIIVIRGAREVQFKNLNRKRTT